MISLLSLSSDKSDLPLGHPWLLSAGTGKGNFGHRQLFLWLLHSLPHPCPASLLVDNISEQVQSCIIPY